VFERKQETPTLCTKYQTESMGGRKKGRGMIRESERKKMRTGLGWEAF
jgi:hypothetical protein